MPEIIERYLDAGNVERTRTELAFLLKAVRGSYGELELAFRKGRLSVYYRGNSLATIVFRPAGSFYVDIHERFFEGAGLDSNSATALVGRYRRAEVDAKGVHRLLKSANVSKLMRAIREVNHSEELAFEQILITDNPPSPGFLFIDRQVQDRHMQRRLDLLGLRRLSNGRYGFVVVEVKLGKNGELSEAVASQLQTYVDHIKREAEAYSRCYALTYRQRFELGLIGESMPDSIQIDGEHVEGLVAVGGYTQKALAQADSLMASHPDIRVRVFRNRLYSQDGRLFD
jgi:hypothetical protein